LTTKKNSMTHLMKNKTKLTYQMTSILPN